MREGNRTIEFANDRLRLTFAKAMGRWIEFRTKEIDGTDVIALVSLSAKPERVVVRINAARDGPIRLIDPATENVTEAELNATGAGASLTVEMAPFQVMVGRLPR